MWLQICFQQGQDRKWESQEKVNEQERMSDSYFSLHVHPLLWGLLLILYVKGEFTFAYVLKMQKQQNGLFNMKQNERVLIKIVIENKIIIGFRAKKKVWLTL